jgi:hypothetical protein
VTTRLTAEDMRQLSIGSLAWAAGAEAAFTATGAAGRLLDLSRRWYLTHRKAILAAADPEAAISSACGPETGQRTTGTGDQAVTLPGSLPASPGELWAAFTELELWDWPGLSWPLPGAASGGELTASVAARGCGLVAQRVASWLHAQDQDRPQDAGQPAPGSFEVWREPQGADRSGIQVRRIPRDPGILGAVIAAELQGSPTAVTTVCVRETRPGRAEAATEGQGSD